MSHPGSERTVSSTGVGPTAGPGELAELLVEHAREALVALAADGTVLAWGGGARRLFGVGAEDARSRSLVELVARDQREAVIRALAEAVASGRASLRIATVRDDGSRGLVEAELTAVRDGAGAVRLVALAALDASAEARLHRAEAMEARFRGLLEAAPDAMVIVGGDRTIAIANAQTERLFGYRREEIVGQPMEVLIPERFRAGHVAHRDRYFAEPRARPMGAGLDLFARRKDGTEFPVEISLSPMHTDEGMLVTAAIRDVTERRAAEAERRRAEEAVRHLNKELEAFSYSVSHDLRAPLRAMDGFSQVLLEDYAAGLDESGRDYLARIRLASQRMARLIDDLLALSRLGRTELRRGPVDLTAAARSIAAELGGRDPARRIAWDLAPGLDAQGDARLLQIALQNLLENAWKFTRQQPEARIGLGVREEGGERVYQVTDNGVGFEMAYASKLFSPFQRLHTQTEFEGTGIGLVTVQRIVHRHGGRIWVDSAVGRGTTFSFTLGGAEP